MKGVRRIFALGFLLAAASSTAHALLTATEVTGKVDWHRPGDPWAPVAEGKVFIGGEDLQTGPRSRCILTLEDASRVELAPDSTFGISQAPSREMRLDVGRMTAWVTKTLIGRRAFVVRSGVMVATVRGTEFTMEVAGSGAARVQVASGIVDVTTILGEAIPVGPGQILDITAEGKVGGLTKEREGRAPGEEEAGKTKTAAVPVAPALEEFKKDVQREVALGLSRDAVQAAAAIEQRTAEYQEGKTMIDVFGQRVRLEQYIVRPAADQFKFVVLNERQDRFDYFYYQAQFNQALPGNLSDALRYLNGKTGTPPPYFITAFETGRSNTIDRVQENGTGGHLVNASLAQDTVVYDPATNAFTNVAAGTAFWSTLFNNYSYQINGAEKFGWQPNGAVVNITGYDYTATGINTRILGGGAFSAAGAVTAGGVTCTSQICENANRPSVVTNPEGATNLHQRVTITYAGDPGLSQEIYDFYVVGNEGNQATVGDFNGVTTGAAYKNTLLKFNYQQTITATAFGGRKIDLVVSPKILVQSGVIQ